MTPRPTILDHLRSRVTGTAADLYVARRVEQRARAAGTLERHAKLVENIDYMQSMVDLFQSRYGDGFMPVGLLAGKDSRRAGRNIPIVFNETNLDIYRQSSRLLYDTNDYVTGLIDRITDYTCQRGFNWTAYRLGEKPATDAADIPPELRGAQAVLDMFKRRDRFRSRERELCKRGHRDGEAFVRMFRSAAGRVPALRTVEPELVCRPNCAPDENGPFSFGVLTHPDDVEKPLAYHVRNSNAPGVDGEIVLAGGLLPDEEAEAREIISDVCPSLPIGPGRLYHYKCNVDRTQKRGMPTLAAAASGYDKASKLLSNVVDTSTLQAAIYMIRQHIGGTVDSMTRFTSGFKDGTFKQAGAGSSTSGMTVRDVPIRAQGGSHVVDSNDALNYLPGPVNTGIPNFLAAGSAQLRKGCVRVGAPEHIGTGDASNNNYASVKEAGAPFVVASEGRQMDLADFEEILADDVLRMTVPSDGQGFDGVCVSVTPPPVAIKSDLDQDQQRQIQNQCNVLSVTTWQKQAGLKPEVEQANFAKERELNPDGGDGMTLPGDFGADDPTPTGGDSGLRQTVGGLNAIAALQADYYAGRLPRQAAIANVIMLFGFSMTEANALFPIIAPQKLTPDEAPLETP